jgi:cyclohexyl-isocyanide hydratase
MTDNETPMTTTNDVATPTPVPRLEVGFLVYPRQDQIDFTGPFEVLSRMPSTTTHVIAKDGAPFRDVVGLILTPEMTLADAPPLDLLVVPGGLGQEALMEDEAILSFIQRQAASGRWVYSVCTGALLCGAAGILRGKRATTHWTALDLLPYFGAIPVESRVVVDGNFMSSSGVTAGLDGALLMAAKLRGVDVAQQIQLEIEYAPDPPFRAGSPKTAPPSVLRSVQEKYRPAREARRTTACRIATKLGVGKKC